VLPGIADLLGPGQEAGLRKRLSFFDKDAIEWRPHEFSHLYTTLLQLKRKHRALWNGQDGGELVRITPADAPAVYGFVRTRAQEQVLVLVNLSGRSHQVKLERGVLAAAYTEVFTGQKTPLANGMELPLKPWEYRVFATGPGA
jgi:hypothetical protein